MHLATRMLMKINNPNTIRFEMIIRAFPAVHAGASEAFGGWVGLSSL
jgi:hypothetical protein